MDAPKLVTNEIKEAMLKVGIADDRFKEFDDHFWLFYPKGK